MKVHSELSDRIKNYKREPLLIESKSPESVLQTARNLSVVTYHFGLKVPELLTDPACRNEGRKYLDAKIEIGRADACLQQYMIPYEYRTLDDEQTPLPQPIKEIRYYLKMTNTVVDAAQQIVSTALDSRPVNYVSSRDSVIFTGSVLGLSGFMGLDSFNSWMPNEAARHVVGGVMVAIMSFFAGRYIKGERQEWLRAHPRPPEPTDYFGQLRSYLSAIHETGALPQPPACLLVSPRCPRRGPTVAG